MSERIGDLSDAVNVLSEALRGKVVVWLGRRASDAQFIFELTGTPPILVCADLGIEPEPVNSGAIYMQDGLVRLDWNTHDLIHWFSSKQVIEQVRDLAAGREIIVLPYQSNGLLETLCSALGWRLLATSVEVKSQFHHKVRCVQLMTANHVNTLWKRSVEVADIRNLSWEQAKQSFETEFVVQYPHGSGGNATFLVHDLNSWQVAVAAADTQGTMAMLVPFVSGPSPNVNAVVTRYGAVVYPPSYQIIGVPSLGREQFSYCGNQFPVGADLARRVREVVLHAGYVLRSQGYRGIFGADLVEDNLLEINDRFNNGTQLLNRLCLSRGVIPPLALHLLEMLRVDYVLYIDAMNDQLSKLNLHGFQMVMHNTEDLPVEVTQQLQPGLFSYSPDLEVVLTGGVPELGTVIHPDATILKIQGVDQVWDPQTHSLSKWAGDLIRSVKSTMFEPTKEVVA